MLVQVGSPPLVDMRASEQRARQAEVRLAEATVERDSAVEREAAAAQEVDHVRQSSREEIARARQQLQVSSCGCRCLSNSISIRIYILSPSVCVV